jgi:two-component system sensor histidine kinase and response regulator WspE
MNDPFSLMDLFREEVRAHAATLNQGLLALEKNPANPLEIEPLMRAAHSIKGACRIVNIDVAVQLAHVMEDAFVAAQEGRIRIGAADIDVLLRGADVLGGLSALGEADHAAWSERQAADVADLRGQIVTIAKGQSVQPSREPVLRQQGTPGVPGPVAPPTFASASLREETALAELTPLLGDNDSLLDLFREEIRSATKVLRSGLDTLESQPSDLAPFEDLGQAARAVAGASRIIGAEKLARLGQCLGEVFGAAGSGRSKLTSEDFADLAEAIGLLAQVIPQGAELAAWLQQHGGNLDDLGERLRGRTLDSAASLAPSASPVLLSPSVRGPIPPPAAGPSQETLPAPSASGAEGVVRVAAQSLNRLMGLAGQALVQARWLEPFSTALGALKKQQDHLAGVLDRLSQALAAGRRKDQIDSLVNEARDWSARCREVLGERLREFQDHAAQTEDLNSRLHREVISSRMRPFADGSHAFPRLVRDMARALGKAVALDILGQTTEVDRDILEKLEAPLTHLVRNALDHGLESPEVRRAAGKPETGMVRIEARHRAGMLALTVSDDGAGIDLDKLRRKVVERGLATTEMVRSMTEAELLEFLFLPGFSTASTVTEFSGRGVGLDVVQTTIRTIGGSVRITTQPGRGTAFHLQLPITLSVLRAVLVDISGEVYAFPHNRIDRLLRVPSTAIRSLEHRQFILVDGQNVGLVLAAQLLDSPSGTTQTPAPTGDLPVVLLSDQTGQYGLIVESFRGEQDLVVRPLDARLGKVANISAAAILDDGSPVLIADVEDLIRSMDQFIQGNTLRRYDRAEREERRQKRVLVVDDSITVREVERQLLRNQGYDVTVAVDGQQGLNMVQSDIFDLVVSDIDMPRMNGLELVRALRADPGLSNLPVIIVSYKEREDDRLRGLEAGANTYLTKSSFHDNTFLRAVTDLIGEA